MTTKRIAATKTLVPKEHLEQKILLIRGKKVMLDRDLAQLYEVETKVLKQAVKRNLARFPKDFMLLLTQEEVTPLRSQIVTSNWGGTRYLPFAFTEQGVAMLSSILNNERAIMVNIEIIRTFVQLRKLMSSHKDLKRKIESMEKKYDHQFRVVFETIKRLIDPPLDPKEPIGFHANKPISKIKKTRRKNNVS